MAGISPIEDNQLSESGVSYSFQYVGNIEVPTSMREVDDFDLRTNLTRECIYRVCRKANLVDEGSGHVLDRRVEQLLGPTVGVELFGKNVDFVINTRTLTVVHADQSEILNLGFILLHHPLPSVSFASAGDKELADYVCYVAKDERLGRRCFVFRCGSSLSANVLTTIGESFHRREQLVNKQRRTSTQTHPNPSAPTSQQEPLINFEVPFASVPTKPAPEYVNDSVISAHNDTIKFSPISLHPPSNADLLSRELWYHGPLSRDEATRLLKRDGDFLVRQSSKDPSQFILSGMQNGIAKHLLLIDDKGKVRTKDMEFQNVSHLIQYHRDNKIPITSEESALLLLNAINKIPQ